jgi:hypothetical protein
MTVRLNNVNAATMADLMILESDYSPLGGQSTGILEVCQTKARLPQSTASSQVQHDEQISCDSESKLRENTTSAERVTLDGMASSVWFQWVHESLLLI